MSSRPHDPAVSDNLPPESDPVADVTWPAAIFESLYQRDPDPWHFETSAYEREKYAKTLACVGEERFGLALELGCSIGIMTRALAARCNRLIAVDAAPTALAYARSRCGDLDWVSFHQGLLPREFPDLAPQSCNLIMISEVLYFLSLGDIDHLARLVLQSRHSDARLILVNWTGKTNTPCSGDVAADRFIARCCEAGLKLDHATRHDGYRLDSLS
jgi:SAM-dependent methyltransferase